MTYFFVKKYRTQLILHVEGLFFLNSTYDPEKQLLLLQICIWAPEDWAKWSWNLKSDRIDVDSSNSCNYITLIAASLIRQFNFTTNLLRPTSKRVDRSKTLKKFDMSTIYITRHVSKPINPFTGLHFVSLFQSGNESFNLEGSFLNPGTNILITCTTYTKVLSTVQKLVRPKNLQITLSQQKGLRNLINVWKHA